MHPTRRFAAAVLALGFAAGVPAAAGAQPVRETPWRLAPLSIPGGGPTGQAAVAFTSPEEVRAFYFQCGGKTTEADERLLDEIDFSAWGVVAIPCRGVAGTRWGIEGAERTSTGIAIRAVAERGAAGGSATLGTLWVVLRRPVAPARVEWRDGDVDSVPEAGRPAP